MAGFKFDGNSQDIDLSIGGDVVTNAPTEKPRTAAPKNTDNIPQQPTQKPPRGQKEPEVVKVPVRTPPKQQVKPSVPVAVQQSSYNSPVIEPESDSPPFNSNRGSRPSAPRPAQQVPVRTPVQRPQAPSRPTPSYQSKPEVDNHYVPEEPEDFTPTVQKETSYYQESETQPEDTSSYGSKAERETVRNEPPVEDNSVRDFTNRENGSSFERKNENRHKITPSPAFAQSYDTRTETEEEPYRYSAPDDYETEQEKARKFSPAPKQAELEDDDYEEEEEDEKPEKLGFFAPRPPKNKKNKTSTKTTKNSTSKTSANSKSSTRPPGNKKNSNVKSASRQSSYAGGRKSVFYIRTLCYVVFGVLIFSGIKASFFAEDFPKPAQIIGVVRNDLGVTQFPVSKATSFVIDFTKAYMTQTPDNSAAREETLKQFVNSGVLNAMEMRVDNSNNFTQTLVGEPIITGVDSIDDNNAVFTVQVSLSTGTNLEMSIPIYYDPKKNAMAVAAPVSTLPAITLAEVPSKNHSVQWASDEVVVKAFQSDLENYLKSWAASDSGVLERYISTNATLTARTGLSNTFTFKSLEDLKVQVYDEEAPNADPTRRDAKFSVVWADTKSPNVTYKQHYLLKILQQPDKRWYIEDISSVIVPEVQ